MNDVEFKLATQHHRAGRLAEAQPLYEQILSRYPNHAEARAQHAYLLYQLGRPQQALPEIERAIRQGSSFAPSHNTLGLTLVALGRADEAIAAYQKAIKVRPDLAELHNNLGNALEMADRLDEALASLRRAMALRSNSPEMHNNLGRILKKLGKFNEAVAEHLEAIRLDPNAEGRMDLGLLHLLLGDFRRGWLEYEARWKSVESSVPQPAFDQTFWDGSQLNGRRILIHPEGGFGDAIQMLRYVPLVAARGGKVLLGVPRELATLLENYPGVHELIPSQQTLPEFDVHCPMASLPRLFDTTVDNVPATVPNLYPPKDRVEYWKARLSTDTNLKVGLVWAGRPDYANDHNRSLPLARLAPLADVPGVTFYSLQKGPAAAEQAKNPPKGMKLVDFTADLTDFRQTASLIPNLDLVIAVDTSVVHVTGALGKPVWVMLPWVCDWRWMLDRDDSPWYPTLRLFRQPAPKDWDTPINRIAAELRRSASGRETR
jgi:Flp pilus assembly protein TadD